jgi:hypothetical protein
MPPTKNSCAAAKIHPKRYKRRHDMIAFSSQRILQNWAIREYQLKDIVYESIKHVAEVRQRSGQPGSQSSRGQPRFFFNEGPCAVVAHYDPFSLC